MPDGPVIINNTPLVALFVLKMLALLCDLFGDVWIPEAVWDEFLVVDRAARMQALSEQPNLMLVSLSNQRNALMLTGLVLQEAGLYLHPSLIARALTLAHEE